MFMMFLFKFLRLKILFIIRKCIVQSSALRKVPSKKLDLVNVMVGQKKKSLSNN